MNKVLFPLVAGLALTAAAPYPAAAQQTCRAVDAESDVVLPGVTLTYDSSFRCANVPNQGTYELTVTVENATESVQAVELETLEFRGTSPRPRGRRPSATAQTADLPVRVDPGASATFDVSGSYRLVSTDEGDKANLHLRIEGVGATDGEPFDLGLNVHLRGRRATR